MFEKNENKVEKNETTKRKTAVSTNKGNSGNVSLNSEARKKLSDILTKANKKNIGKKIRASRVIISALEKITDEDISIFQKEALRGKDFLEEKMNKYIKKNGKITRDEFLKVLVENSNLGLA